MAKLLDNINSPQDMRNLNAEQLTTLAEEIRLFITESVSRTGGHLASNLGIVELTIAMHYVFDFSRDKLLWDVGHQCYAHKILTGRRELFSKLRQQDGVSGFPDPTESSHDVFAVGHAGTSIATAIGMALGASHNRTDEKIVAFVGDASIVNGTSFEALNNLGLVKRQLLIILNDNSMAIDVTQGAIAKFLLKVRLSHTYEDLRRRTDMMLEHLPLIGRRMEDAIKNLKKTLRMAISPSRLFESLNIPYFGPVDGHDIGALVELFKTLSNFSQPVILHVYTKKGKGFTPADDNPRMFHSTGPFKINGNEAAISRTGRSFTEAFGKAVVALAEKNDRVVAITAAMSDGTGLAEFRNRFPARYYDVGIAESAAIDIAAGLAKQGLRPIVCIYSTFLQRAFDQIFQEVALQNLPVVFCIDRGGLVGNDGPTHHGLMDIAFLRVMPNFVLVSPSDENELAAALDFAAKSPSPVAIRYPKDTVPQGPTAGSPDGATDRLAQDNPFATGKSLTVRSGKSDIVIVALGSILSEALAAARELEKRNIDVSVINARFAKPVDTRIIELLYEGKTIITVEDHSLAGGFGSAVMELAAQALRHKKGAPAGRIICLGAPDEFIKAASRSQQIKQVGIDTSEIVNTIETVSTRLTI